MHLCRPQEEQHLHPVIANKDLDYLQVKQIMGNIYEKAKTRSRHTLYCKFNTCMYDIRIIAPILDK